MEWNFPSTNNGQIKGVADAGIETFQGDGIKALTRETCQNSLDAIADNKKAVHMEFKQYYKESGKIPGHTAYKLMLRKALKYWEGNSEKATSFLKSAIQSIEGGYTNILRISDYNTCGLSEPYKIGFGSWNALTKIDGGATKSGDSAGSYGIGKNAPYVCTAYRMVFYRTLNANGESAAQGMSRLLSYELDDEGNFTTGTGYYGNSETNGPVERIPELDELEIRDEIGTDIFVYGLSVVNTKSIKQAIFTEILNNFLMAIYREKLTVGFGKEVINTDTLEKYVMEYKSKIKDSYCAWLALNDRNSEKRSMEFHGLGTIRFRILVSNEEKLNRKVLVTRKSGMKLFFMKGISKTISFTGVLELEGEELNIFFRKMETPAHDKWKAENHSDPDLAKEYIGEIRSWITNQVNDIGATEYSDEIAVTGLAATLNEQRDEIIDKKEKSEGINNFLGQIELVQRDIQKQTQGIFIGVDTSNRNSDARLDFLGATTEQKTRGTLDPQGKLEAIRKLKGTRSRKTTQTHKGYSEPVGKDMVLQGRGKGKGTSCPLQNVRVMKTTGSQYKVTYIIPYSVSKGHMEIVTVGENGKSTKLNIINASAIKNCDEVKVKDGNVEFDGMLGNEKVQMMFTLADSRNYAMEVKVYEHN